MRDVPPEIDDLMWRLAEEGGSAARSEFEARYTRFAPELARRIQMVGELRQAGKPIGRRPVFTPRPVRVVQTPPWAIGGMIGLAVLAVGAVAYVVASSGEHPQAPPIVRRVETRLPVVPAPIVTYAPPSHGAQTVPPSLEVPKEEPVPEKTPDYRKPRDLRIAETDLTSAINLVAMGSGLQVTIAPGFPNRKVSLDYRSISPIDMLKAMGDEYGFSVLEEEEGHVLVVPARASTAPERRIGP